MAAHLPGMCGTFPNAGGRYPNVREKSGGCGRTLFNRTDAAGNPVATVAIDGGMNAAILQQRSLQCPIRSF